jgi:hypothetical protein
MMVSQRKSFLLAMVLVGLIFTSVSQAEEFDLEYVP